ncbi:hypothetical protein ZIOFF_065810 [Zingiber officinale]|uniref:Uncharacterized protein n=1 Tax=Zingiber officinale TaxID=94328 RepID=A0A8J5KDE6_ZINOF|nr:hypothetical protein ZIOFF_065810 [Zingiber officinale]
MGYFREPSESVSRVASTLDPLPSRSSGIRAKTARVMALHSAHVIIKARNLKVVDVVKQHILQNTPSVKINIIELKLSSQKSVRAFTDKFLTMNLPLNILM